MGLAAGTVSGHVASLSLNRPEVPNALNHGLTEQLAAALEGADRDPQVRAVAHR
ncbi:MAG: enoyl-CoA hydratase-related protein [Actinomycetia bacterium]|nr:enoyl-CoA hydratase-related protein [Actinomycetes bacterium]